MVLWRIAWFKRKYVRLIYRHECFTGKYTTRKIHTNLFSGIEDINDTTFRFSTIVYVNSLSIKSKLHGGLKIWILFSRVKNSIILIRSFNDILTGSFLTRRWSTERSRSTKRSRCARS